MMILSLLKNDFLVIVQGFIFTRILITKKVNKDDNIQ